MKRWAKIRCEFWFYLGCIADRLLVQPIPDAVWHLQRPGAWLYQKCMGRSFLIDKKYELGEWKPETVTDSAGETRE